ncbi:MAG: hypothetical protein OEO84_09310 [Betaproteobacteria bacterium]|nr:hypothetical protein [Betaproteobacteria bacterium]
MNAYEIGQIEKDIRANFRLPLSYSGWADIERHARQERARVLGEGFSRFVAAAWAKLVGLGRGMRSTAADCTDARLTHS